MVFVDVYVIPEGHIYSLVSICLDTYAPDITRCNDKVYTVGKMF